MALDLNNLIDAVLATTDLQRALERLDSLGLLAAGAFVNQAMCLVHDAIEEEVKVVMLELRDESAFSDMNEMLDMIFMSEICRSSAI